MNNYDVIIIGAGLAGLTAAYELASKGKKVILLEQEQFLGGRTASWNENSMIVESGFHRHIGYYKEMPKLLSKVGININDIVMWEKEIEIKLLNKKSIILGMDPFLKPLTFLKGIVANKDVLSFKDKTSLLRFFIAGLKDYKINPKELDKYSISNYAKKHKVTKNCFKYLITSLSTGIFFLPPEEYSAKVFFGLFYPALFRGYKIRVGAYLGGMSDIIAKPIANAIEAYGGVVRLNAKVSRIIRRIDKVIGVELDNEEKINAPNVILATDINHAKKLIKPIAVKHSWFDSIMNMPTMSALTIQFDLSERALKYDRTTFAPETMLTSFTEQSCSTFKHVKGRLSIIIAEPKKYIDLSDDNIKNLVIDEALKLGIDLKSKIVAFRVVRERDKFYHLGPNNDYFRPTQQTPIKGLILAGDYTRQMFYATMEGAVLSGIKAANLIDKNDK